MLYVLIATHHSLVHKVKNSFCHWWINGAHRFQLTLCTAQENGADRLMLAWLACQTLLTPMWHLYSCMYTIKLLMRAYGHLVVWSNWLLCLVIAVRWVAIYLISSTSLLTCLLLTVRREVHKSVVSKRATLRTSKMVSTLNKTLPQHQQRLWLVIRKLWHLPKSSLIPIHLQPLHPQLQLQLWLRFQLLILRSIYGYLQPPPSHTSIYAPQPDNFSDQLIPPLRAHSGQYIYPEYSSPAPIPQILSTARVSSPSGPPAAVPPMSPWCFSGANLCNCALVISNLPVLSQLQLQSQIIHPSFCCMWHLFPVISFPSLIIAAILSHSMRLFQEMMTCLTRSFPNELNAGYSGDPCLRSWLWEVRQDLFGIVQNLRGMVEQDVQS